MRAAAPAGATTTHYIYGLGGGLIAEADGATTAEYIAFNGKTLAYVTTSGIYWVHADHLGTPQVRTGRTLAPKKRGRKPAEAAEGGEHG